MRGQLGDGSIGRAAVVEERHDGQKATAIQLERVETHLRIPWNTQPARQPGRLKVRARAGIYDKLQHIASAFGRTPCSILTLFQGCM